MTSLTVPQVRVRLNTKGHVGADATLPLLPASPVLDLSARAYQVLVGLTVLIYLVLWLMHFPYVYGWFADDRMVYSKGLAVVQDWKVAFAPINANQPYFFLISYLPLKLALQFGLRLPSYPQPGYEALSGQFRLLLLYAVFVHTAILLLWAWCAVRLTSRRLIAWLSLVLFASSPTLMLWTPQPESRLFPLLFMLPGVVLLLRVDPAEPAGWRGVGRLFVLGSLWGVGQSIHHTGFYLSAPLLVAYWSVGLWRGWRRGAYWRGIVAFGLGCVWVQGLLEGVSYFVVHIPWQQGPLMTLVNLTYEHRSSWSTLGNLRLWAEWFRSQMGPVLVATIGLGWWMYLRETRAAGAEGMRRLFIAVGIPLGLLYLGLWGKEAFFRQTSVLQPFLFLFAATAIVALARWVGRRRACQVGLLTALLVVVGAVQWEQAAQVFEGHQGWGRALEWAYMHKGDHKLETTRVEFYGDTTSITTLEDLEQSDPDALLLTYIPTDFLIYHASLQPALARTMPLAAWPTLWSTRAMEAEIGAYWPNSHWWDNPVANEARVYRIGDILDQMRGLPLQVASITADSVAAPTYEAVNVFDRERSPDGAVVWASATTAMPHWVAVEFVQPVRLSAMNIVQPAGDLATRKITDLEVQVAGADGDYRTVWRGQDLAKYFVIATRWEPVTVTHVRVIVYGQPFPWADSPQGIIEEIEFPGYNVVAPAPERSFPELTLEALAPSTRGIMVTGTHLSRETRLVVDGVRLPAREGDAPGQMLALLPVSLQNRTGEVEAYLSDGFRRSNSLSIGLPGPLRLTRIIPASTRAGQKFNVQSNGDAVLGVEGENIYPGTKLVMDGQVLATTFGGSAGLSVTVPPEYFGQPGRHEVYLTAGSRESNRLEFVVEP